VNSHIDECLTMRVINEEKPSVEQLPVPPANTLAAKSEHRAVLTDSDYARRLAALTEAEEIEPPLASPVRSTNNVASAPSPSPSPFSVTCPYCFQRFEACDFPAHVFVTHSNASSHALACPICSLISNTSYSVTANTNLFEHLSWAHGEFVPRNAVLRSLTAAVPKGPVAKPSPPPSLSSSPSPNRFVNSPASVIAANIAGRGGGGGADGMPNYVISTLQLSLGKECTVCLEEFTSGQMIVTLECFCMYHKTCAEAWWQRSKSCPLHKPE